MTQDAGDKSDLEVEAAFVTEYGWSLVSVAERLLRFKALLLGAGSESAREELRDDYREFLRRVNDCNKLALVALGAASPSERKHMNWSNIWSKVQHATIIGAGAGVAVLVGALTGGTGFAALPFALAAKTAIGGALVYMVKSARPDVPPAP